MILDIRRNGGHLEWVDICLCLEPMTKYQPEGDCYFPIILVPRESGDPLSSDEAQLFVRTRFGCNVGAVFNTKSSKRNIVYVEFRSTVLDQSINLLPTIVEA